MVKKGMKWFSLMLVTTMVVASLVGCGGKDKESSKKGTSTTDIEISYWNSGLGSEWLDALIEGFEKKYPEYNVYYSATASTEGAKAAYGVEDTDTVDLYMVTKQYNTKFLEPLNDVLDTTVEGESKSIKEKFDPSYLAMEEQDGTYYNLTYGGGLLGFVYNVKMFEEAGIKEIPRTTDEFTLACSKLYDKGYVPLAHFSPNGYYHFLNEAWFAQYDGVDYYKDFYANTTKDKFMAEDGRYETIKVYEKIITPEYVLKGSNSGTHVTIQTKFLEGSCAMMLSGSWLASEMQYSEKMDDFQMMKTPVISAITKKLTTVKSEKLLRELITAIDNVTNGKESVDTYKSGENYVVEGETISAKDWDYVVAARNTMAANYAAESLYIPKYSNAKEGAKEFVKYLYSDEGYKIYTSILQQKLPLSLSEGEIDDSKWNAFGKNQSILIGTTEHFISYDYMNRHRIFTDGGAGSGFPGDPFINHMCSNNAKDRVGSKQVWGKMIKLIDEEYDTWLSNIK